MLQRPRKEGFGTPSMDLSGSAVFPAASVRVEVRERLSESAVEECCPLIRLACPQVPGLGQGGSVQPVPALVPGLLRFA